MAEKHILIICGEPSGDLNAANLARAILEINPAIKISAVGGDLLRQAKAKILWDIKDLSVIGLFDVLKKLPKFFALKKFILDKINLNKPDAIILVDFSGFNLRLAKEINKSIPVIYYVSPQVWASRPGRVKTIKEYIHKMIVLFKFEKEFYKNQGLDVDWVGHPLLDIVKPSADKKQFLSTLGFKENVTTIALLPGSRRQEIRNILPVMLKCAEIIGRKIPDAQFIIAKTPQTDINIYKQLIGKNGINLKIVEGKTYDCLNAADFSLVASGTATLEAAIIENPFAVIYKMNLLNYLLYRPQVKVPFIGMVNIVAGKRVVPEFIQFNANPKRIANETLRILNNPSEVWRIKNDLLQVKSSLGEKGASLRAAKIITDYIAK